jgi:hypothetical protein
MKKLIFILFILFCITESYAQRPKLYLKAYGGIHWHNFIYRQEVKSSDGFFGWQGGFGFRVSHKRVFGEIDFDFIRSGVTVFLEDSVSQALDYNEFKFKLNAFELPLKFGYIPVKTPFFKWYLYTGTSLRFNTKGKLEIFGQEIKISPKDVDLRVLNVDWILGTQMDVGWLNIDIIYGMGLTNSTKTDIRTNSHEIHLNLGFLF